MDFNDYSQPFKTKIDSFYLDFAKKSLLNKAEISLSRAELFDSVVIPFIVQEDYITSYESISKGTTRINDDELLSIKFDLAGKGTYYKRNIYNVFNLLADLGGFIFIIYIIFAALIDGFTKAELKVYCVVSSFFVLENRATIPITKHLKNNLVGKNTISMLQNDFRM